MRSTRGILALLAGLFALVVLSGCARYCEERKHGPGEFVSRKSFEVWPLFEAEHTVYTGATHDEGNVLLFISWSRWNGRPPAPRPEACPVPAAEPKAAPAETPEPSGAKPNESPE